MNYLSAKIELLKEAPQIPFRMMAIEAAAMVGVAGLLVQVFT